MKNVYVLEDDPLLKDTLCAVVEDIIPRGNQLSSFGTFGELVKAVDTDLPAAIISDLGLPDASIAQVIDLLNRLAAQGVQVLVHSGDLHACDQLSKDGRLTVIRKQSNPDALMDAIGGLAL